MITAMWRALHASAMADATRMFLTVLAMALHRFALGCPRYPLLPMGCPQLPRLPRIAQIVQHDCGSCYHGTAHDCSGCQELPRGLPTDAQVAKDCPGCSACLWQTSPWHCI